MRNIYFLASCMLAFLTISFLPNPIQAQFPFQVTHQIMPGTTEGRAIDQIGGTPNYVIAGDYLPSNNTRQVLVSEVDDNGNPVWASVIGQVGTQNQAHDVKAAPIGALVVAGISNFTSNGDNDGLLVQLGPSGNVQWGGLYGDPGMDDGLHAVIDYNGFAYACTGYQEEFNPVATSKDMFFLIA